MKNVKGLIIGRNPINNVTANGKTIATFYKRFAPEQLANIFVTNLPIDKSLCNNYYRIDEKVIIPFSLFKNSSGIIKTNKISYINGIKYTNSFSEFLKKIFDNSLGLLIRNFLWEHSMWEKMDLVEWIKSFSPDFIHYDVGNLPFEFEYIIRLKKILNKPLVLCANDDYIFNNDSVSCFDKIYNNLIQKEFLKLSKHADLCIVISEALKNKYIKHFNCKFVVAMNGCDINTPYIYDINTSYTPRMVYIGNLGMGRINSLKVLGKALKLLHKENFRPYIEVYSPVCLTHKEKEFLESCGTIKCCGAVFGTELNNIRNNANILLHVEGFDLKYKNILSTALTTKLPEILYTNRPILAFGPIYSESINFISRNNFGFVITNNEIINVVNSLNVFFDKYYKMSYPKTNHQYAVDYMSKDYYSDLIYNSVLEVIK